MAETYPASVTFTPRGIDEVRAQISSLRAELVKLRKQSDDNSKSPLPDSTEKLGKAFAKLEASVDPLIAKQQKLDAATKILDATLSKGLITQQKHADLLDKLKQKYSDTANPLETLKSKVGELSVPLEGLGHKVGELSGIITQFGGEAGRALSEFAEKLTSIGEIGSGAVASLGPLAVVAAALAVALAAISVGVVAFDWLKDVAKEGMKTQDVVEGLNQALRSNGSATGESAKDMIEYAETLSVATGKSKESIVQAEAQLSRFDHLGNNLHTIINLSLDYAQAQTLATGHEVSAAEAAAKLGPVYEGKAKALLKLSDVGIVVDAGQKKYLQSLIDTGRLEEYRAIITEKLTQKVGDLAAVHAGTLAGGIERGRNEYKLFQETIASEILPALKSVFDDLIKQAGGWEKIHYVVQSAALDIGDIIRSTVYGIQIAYHDWEASQDTLDARILSGFASVLETVGSVQGFFAKIPIPLNPFRNMADDTAKMVSDLRASANEYEASAAKEAQASLTASLGLAEHKRALEGDDEVHKKHNVTIDEAAKKTHELKTGIDQAKNAYDNLVNSVQAMLLKLGEEISDRNRLIAALKISSEEHDKVKAQIAAEKQLRVDQASLLKSYETAVKEGNKAVEESTKNYGANSEQTQKAKVVLAEIVTEYGHAKIELEKLGTANIEQAKAEKQAEINAKEFAKAIANLGQSVLESYKQQIEAAKQLNAAKAALSDEQVRIEITQKYGAAVAGLVVQLGGASQATRQYTIDSKVDAEVQKSKISLTYEEITAIRNRITAQYDALAAVKHSQAELTLKADVWKPMMDGWEPAAKTILDDLATIAKGGHVTAEDIGRTLLDQMIKAFEQILINWLKLQLAMEASEDARIARTAALNAAVGNSSAASGAGVTGLQSGGLSSIGGQPGGLFGGGGSGGMSAGTIASYALVAYAAFVAYKVFFENSSTDFAQVTIAGQGVISSANNSQNTMGNVSKAATQLLSDLNQFLVNVNVKVESLGDITFGKRGSNYFVKVGAGVEQAFASAAEAQQFAEVAAIKTGKFADSVSAMVQATIRASKAINTQMLDANIQFAQRIEMQNLPQLQTDIHNVVTQFINDFQHVLNLFGAGAFAFRPTMDQLLQLGPATSSVLLHLQTSLQGFYDQLTGHQVDAAEQAERQRVAYNAERAITIAQIVLLEEKIQAEIADYQAQQLNRTNRGGQEGGGVSGDPGAPAKLAANDVVVEVIDNRNPTDDPKLAALLTVLDNLARALAGLPPIINPGEMKLPTTSTASGRNNNALQALQALTDASNKQWEQRDMSALGKQIDDINDKYDKAIANTHAKSKAAAKAIEEANVAREHEIELAKQVAAKGLEDRLKSYTDGGKSTSSPQDALQGILDEGQKVRDDLIKTAKEVGYTADQVSAALMNIQAAEDAREQALIKQVTGGLNLPIQQTRDQASKLSDAVGFLRSEADKGKISVEKLGELLGQIAGQGRLQLLGIASGLLDQMGQFDAVDKLKREMDEINFQIQRVQFNILLDQYELLGLITGALKDRLEQIRNNINDPTKWPDFSQPAPTRPSTSAASAQTQNSVNTFAAAVNKFDAATQALLQSYQSLFTDPTFGGSTADRLKVAQEGFKPVEHDALAGDVEARAKFGQQATDYLKVLFDATGGGALYYSELARIKGEFQTLFAQTRFTVDGVSYDSRMGANIDTFAAGSATFALAVNTFKDAVAPAIPDVPLKHGRDGFPDQPQDAAAAVRAPLRHGRNNFGSVAAYDDQAGSPVAPGTASIVSPATGGYIFAGNASTASSASGTPSADTAILQQIAASIIHLEGALMPIANTVANNTGSNRQQLASLISDLERIIPYLRTLAA